MVGHGGSSAGSYLADPTSPIPSHCASIVATSTVRVNIYYYELCHCFYAQLTRRYGGVSDMQAGLLHQQRGTIRGWDHDCVPNWHA